MSSPARLRAGVLAAACALIPVASFAAARQSGGLRLEPAGGIEAGAQALDRLPGTDSARDETALGTAFVELVAGRPTAFAGELLRLEVRFGFEARFLDEALIPLFRRHLDLPVQIEAAWLEDPDSLDLTRAFGADPAGDTVSLARNERVARARRLPDHARDGRTFRVYALDVCRIERSPGVLRLASPRLVYSHATAFREDFVHGRTPTERRDGFVAGAGLEVRIDALPEAGRPGDFSGAVGEFRIALRAGWSGVPGRSSVRAEMAIEGDGDLRDVLPPDASSFPGFQVLGVLDDRGRARRNLTFDLEPRAAGRVRLPPVAFHAFDPRPPGRYVVLATAPVELADPLPTVPAVAAGGPGGDRPVPFLWRVVLLLGGGATAAGLLAFALFRSRARRRAAAAGRK